ncbi:MAG: hypothetical protein ACFFC9_14560, partial [Promethearchaeota archaeon]
VTAEAKRAGKNAAEYVKFASQEEISQNLIEEKKEYIQEIYERKKGINYLEIREIIKRIMSENVWIIKTEEKLKNALEEIVKLKVEAKSNIKLPEKSYQYLKGALETLIMIKISEILIRASLIRTESRGAHYREDYPDQDDKNWLKNIILYEKEEELAFYTNEK